MVPNARLAATPNIEERFLNRGACVRARPQSHNIEFRLRTLVCSSFELEEFCRCAAPRGGAMVAKRRAGARWSTAAPVLKSQASRTARRTLLALQAGRVPGKPGPKRTVEGSTGGKNGARAADRRAASRAAKLGVRPKPAKRVAYVKAKPSAGPAMRRRPANKVHLHLLEVFAYKGSVLSHEWAKRGLAAVRIAHRRAGAMAKEGPAPIPGRALTWYLDLDQQNDKNLLEEYAREHSPDDLWTSPACTALCSVQHINKGKRHQGWRPKGEAATLRGLAFCRKLHREQQARGGRSHHEQSASSREPFDGEHWPWAISKDWEHTSTKVAACSVGLYDRTGQKLLAKEWRIETSSERLRIALGPYKCSGGHEHGQALGDLGRTSTYTPFFAVAVAEAILGN